MEKSPRGMPYKDWLVDIQKHESTPRERTTERVCLVGGASLGLILGALIPRGAELLEKIF